jgi:hypothetical protein
LQVAVWPNNLGGGIHLCDAIIEAAFRHRFRQVAYQVNSLPADFLAIATQRLVNAKYWGSQILPRACPAQWGIGTGFRCLTGLAIATQQRYVNLVNPSPVVASVLRVERSVGLGQDENVAATGELDVDDVHVKVVEIRRGVVVSKVSSLASKVLLDALVKRLARLRQHKDGRNRHCQMI